LELAVNHSVNQGAAANTLPHVARSHRLNYLVVVVVVMFSLEKIFFSKDVYFLN